MWRFLRVAVAAEILASCLSCLAQTPLERLERHSLDPPNPNAPGVPSPAQQNLANRQHSIAYQDIDMLRRHAFAAADEASVSLRIMDRAGVTPVDLRLSDFTLIVNGTRREARLHPPGGTITVKPPIVLLVFPPNEVFVHHFAAQQAIEYFSRQSNELLPWRVGIYDANKKVTPFTDSRSQLLASLDTVERSVSPFILFTDTSWLSGAEAAIGVMQAYDGPKVVLAMNPTRQSEHSEELDFMLSHIGPESLVHLAGQIGAHIYIANVGGPIASFPGGNAFDDQPAQVNSPGGPQMGTSPFSHMQVDPNMTQALNTAAYSNSQMMQAAASTLGGFSNSIKDLAAQIHRNLDEDYLLDFDLTSADRDRGIPAVEVRLARRDVKVAIMDVSPKAAAADSEPDAASRKLAALVAAAAKHPVSSPDFRITQRVDYFPLRQGLEPVLPMTCLVEWTGKGEGPAQLNVVEAVEDQTLGIRVLERNIKASWDGHSLSWERDGQLRPGRYLWRVTVHDGNGKILSSSEEKVGVGFPPNSSLAVSSLILGKSCRDDSEKTSGLRQRPVVSPTVKREAEQAYSQIDPMRAAECRVKPEPTENFASTDTLRAFVRIYPAEKLARRTPESWTAKFVLRAHSGAVEREQELPFTVDSGSGYIASIELPLSASGISPGQHTLDVQMNGPGIRKDVKESRTISIK